MGDSDDRSEDEVASALARSSEPDDRTRRVRVEDVVHCIVAAERGVEEVVHRKRVAADVDACQADNFLEDRNRAVHEDYRREDSAVVDVAAVVEMVDIVEGVIEEDVANWVDSNTCVVVVVEDGNDVPDSHRSTASVSVD